MLEDDVQKTFLVRYNYDGAEWGASIQARNLDEARERLNRLAYATIDGELVATLPPSSGFLLAVATNIRNIFHRFTHSSN